MSKSKYDLLTNYLINNDSETIVLSYKEIENILGFMPQSALDYAAPWSDGHGSPFSKSWLKAGYRIKNNYSDKIATFTKSKDVIIEKSYQTHSVKPKASKVEKEIPTPNYDLLNLYLSKWNALDGYVLQEESIEKLFKSTAPSNKDIHDILVKVAVLNDFYSTNIFKVYLVAKHFTTLNLDERLKEGKYDPEVVNDMAVVPGIKARPYSFATKYCSHNAPFEYPIYDSYVDKMLRYYRDRDGFYLFNNDELKDYNKFKEIIRAFKNFYKLSKFSIKEIDKYLWQAGKEYFPKTIKSKK